jgi:hypothetical protein
MRGPVRNGGGGRPFNGIVRLHTGQAHRVTSLSQRFLKSAGRHFVTLSCVETLKDATEKVLVFSGFVVEVAGEWFYVTAGHIVRDVRLATGAGAKFDVWRLDDQSAGHSFGGAAIPLAFDLARWLELCDDEIGLDYAVFHLDGLYRRQLEAGGVVAIAKDAWAEYIDDHDHWALLGVPSESVAYEKKNLIHARIVVAPLESCDEPAAAGKKAQNQFFARLKDPATTLRDIDGMSGGPIFALKKVDGVWKYSVIGVQSAFYDQSRILGACPFPSLGRALEKIVDPIVAQFRDVASNAT